MSPFSLSHTAFSHLLPCSSIMMVTLRHLHKDHTLLFVFYMHKACIIMFTRSTSQSYVVTGQTVEGNQTELEVMEVRVAVSNLPENVHIEYRVAALDVLGNRGAESLALLISTKIGKL